MRPQNSKAISKLHDASDAKNDANDQLDDSQATSDRMTRAVDFWNLAHEMMIPLDVLQTAYDLFSEQLQDPVDEKAKSKTQDMAEKLGMPVTGSASLLSKNSITSCPTDTRHYDKVKDAELSRLQFANVLCKLTNAKTIDELPEGLLYDAFSRADKNGSDQIDFSEFALWFSRHGFSENMLISREEQEVRKVGRRCGMSHTEVDRYKCVFDSFDLDHSGEIEYDEFVQLIYKLIKVPQHLELPTSRIKQFWKDVDIDQGGSIGFEEFLFFYQKYFDLGRSGRCPFEEFYRGLRRVPVMKAAE